MFGHVVGRGVPKECSSKRIPIFVLLSSCLSCYWASHLKLGCCGGYRLLTLVANADWLMPQNVAMSHAMRYSNPGYVERSWRWVYWFQSSSWVVKVRVSGAPIHFLLRNLGNLFIWTKKIQFVTCFLEVPAFLALSLPSTVALGLNFESLFSWNVSHIEPMTGTHSRIDKYAPFTQY